MSYRSVKRVLGETNLERKCRALFGLSLLLLISISFWFYGKRTENLIEEKNLDTGRRLVDSALLKHHWLKWETEKAVDRDRRDEVAAYSRSLENLDYDWRVIAFTPPPEPDERVHPPEDAWEKENLAVLKALLQRQLAEHERSVAEHQAQVARYEEAKRRLKQEAEGAGEGGFVEPALPEPPPNSPPQFVPPSLARRVEGPDQTEYHYYQPVYWKESCVYCHREVLGPGAFSPTADYSELAKALPFRAVKVVIPYGATQRSLVRNRAILWATAISYVIVKPLKHLRDVSDEISRGNTRTAGRDPHQRRVRRTGRLLQPHAAAPDRRPGRTAERQRRPGRQSRRAGSAEHAAVRDEPPQERLPGQHEPRAAHAAEQHHRLFRSAAGGSSR
jgi:two-component system, NarL family, sensor histidine kinase BarA